ncbi:DUF3043 domain-containing protein [Frankia sp. CNm7]|uniref:DUF3043 domain-containing protein n=1 Tax=Frankia nepalensis TaxID=1836974 RepID=A0A937RRJ9_9ACTN|nr:DUF3043 domain-containing protein [Frankia nepalensis]MBL7500678.1 DUF3043 domain-containing protein [Frankia nepalensis]MBL7513136.1 DUF3043 domain-containing protein [Frankia nepalensis]MBL7522809.1 DUF3043 domain-containing protein [Frankia nepalensis]MBL7633589.1 DUF3043 domain-containing protein [Frankia nepalensis]
MASISLRKRSREAEPDADGAVDLDEPVEVLDTRVTAKKGRPTPKRSQARAARSTGGAFGPAANTKEARARARDERRRQMAEQRTALRSGDLSKMPARERAPERVLARDIVDSRINAGTFFLFAIAFYLVGGIVPNSYVRLVAVYVMLLGLLAVAVDGFFLSRKVSKAIEERYPDSRVKVRLYAIQRSLVPRRWRTPPPRVSRDR